MRTVPRTLLILVALLVCPYPPVYAVVRPFPDDAPLRALQFVDEKEGWAAGDDGVIWHTIDGGKTWERQASGTRASLRGMHFVTPYSVGSWAGWNCPAVVLQGVVLTTTDGGLRWTQLTNDNVPGLNCIRFFNDHSGVACGDGSAASRPACSSPTIAENHGQPIPGKRCGSWHAGDFSDMQTGALAGTWGQMATLRDGFFGASDVDPLGNRSILGLKLNGARAVAVGQGGLILTSSKSAGLKWGFVELGLARATLANIDFHAVAVRDQHIWAVGRPGSFVMHSSDFGQSWEMQATGQTLPLHALHFVNENEGWAVGELGTILATEDGGKNWKVRRQGAQRAASVVYPCPPTQPAPLIPSPGSAVNRVIFRWLAGYLDRLDHAKG